MASPTPEITARPAPTAPPKNTAYDPPAGTSPYFKSSIFHKKLSDPTPNAKSSSWISKIAPMGISTFQFAANSSGTSHDYMFPIYNGLNSGKSYKVHCTANYGESCGLEGKTVNILSGMIPESATSSNCTGDCHMALIENGYEYDLYGTREPLGSSTVTIKWGGVCALDGPGYSSCASTATGTALSLGIVRAVDWVHAATTGGTLPYAIQAAVKCSNGHVAPFTGSDGKCSGGAPQGTRGYLALHDSEIDGLNGLTKLAKALLRTIDEDHYGVIITDTNGGQSGLSLQCESDLTYTAFGKPGPWATTFATEARNEGIDVSLSNNVDYVTVPFTGMDWTKFKFI